MTGTDDGGRAGAGTPATLRRFVPGILLTDALFGELCAMFDDLLAPLSIALDCLPAYLEPGTAPEEFLPWLASFVAADVHAESSDTRRAIGRATAGHRGRGTALGVRRRAAAVAHVAVEDVRITESGGVQVSEVPITTRATAAASAVVTVSVAAGVDRERLRAAVTAALLVDWPVHCALSVEVLPA